jgi:hypothetical protein
MDLYPKDTTWGYEFPTEPQTTPLLKEEKQNEPKESERKHRPNCICWGVRFFHCDISQDRFYDLKTQTFYHLVYSEKRMFKSGYNRVTLKVYDNDNYPFTIRGLTDTNYTITKEFAEKWARKTLCQLLV